MARWFVDRKHESGSPSVNLRRLLPEAAFPAGAVDEVSGCSDDARKLKRGELFVAARGEEGDLVARAIERGAAGVLVERFREEAGRLQIVVPDARSAHARIVHALAGDPSRKLRVVGVAGREGAGAVGAYLRAIFEAAGVRCGSLGPSGWSDGLGSRPVGPEFPGVEAVATTLAVVARAGAKAAVLEFDESALATAAAEGLLIEAVVVTDLSGEEDGPDARAERRRAFARLARRVAPGGTVIVAADDPDAEILGACNLDAARATFGLAPSADVFGRLGADGRLRIFGLDVAGADPVSIRLDDPDAARPALAAAAAARALGIEAGAIAAGLESVPRLPGRHELVDEGQPFEVRVDPARTPGELGKALRELRADRPNGRIVCVVGAESPGDPAARRALAEAAEAGSDQVVFTSDNPRTEDVGRIFAELLSGCREPARATVIPDRREAVEAALALAAPGDAVLVAGKGRRAYQILADRVLPFDDRAVAARKLRERAAGKRDRGRESA